MRKALTELEAEARSRLSTRSPRHWVEPDGWCPWGPTFARCWGPRVTGPTWGSIARVRRASPRSGQKTVAPRRKPGVDVEFAWSSPRSRRKTHGCPMFARVGVRDEARLVGVTGLTWGSIAQPTFHAGASAFTMGDFGVPGERFGVCWGGHASVTNMRRRHHDFFPRGDARVTRERPSRGTKRGLRPSA